MVKKIISGVLLGTALSFAQTVVEVNGQEISDYDLRPLLQEISQGNYPRLTKEEQMRVNQMAVNKAISTVLIQQEAKRAKVQDTKAYKEAFKNYVERVVEPMLLYQVWLDENLKKVQVTDAEAKAFFKENEKAFIRPKEVHAHHILVKTEAEAAKIIDELKGSKDLLNDFKAKAATIMGTPETGVSDLGFFSEESPMAPEFKKASFALKAGAMTRKPVKTSFGVHVIFVESFRGGEKKDYKTLKPSVIKAVKAKKFQKDVQALVKKLGENAKIEFK